MVARNYEVKKKGGGEGGEFLSSESGKKELGLLG